MSPRPASHVRVLQVITDTRRRGAQVFAVDLGEALTGRGWDIRTVALTHESDGELDVPVLGPTRTSWRTMRRLRRLIGQAAVVVGHGSTTLPMCGLAGVATGVPFVYRQISDSLYWADTPSRRARVRLFLHRAEAIVALWDGSARVLAEHFGVDPGRIEVVPNGVVTDPYGPADPAVRRDARRGFGLPEEEPVVAYLGALVPEKGVAEVIRAVAAHPPARLLVAGDGPQRPALERLARQQAPERVHFAGWLDRPVEALAAADVVALFSLGGDTMPAVLIEAGLCGLPSVSTPVGAIPEIVVDGRTGLVVPIGDEEALTTALGSLLSNPERARRMGAAARRHCLSRFDLEVVADGWEQVLADVTGRVRLHG